MRGGLHEIAEEQERALIVGVRRPGQGWPLESSMAELTRLVETAGVEVVAQTSQTLDAINPKTFVGSGKAREIAELAKAEQIDVVIFDDELSPTQQSNLEKAVGAPIKVLDRTALILDIFALHATTREGRLQVRLAQNQYLYPRLRGMWAHLASNRMGGGVGSRFGEGESQLEVDRRIVRKRITSIKRELAHLERVRNVQRVGRMESGIARIALAGYTNAGKSSLINRLCDADVLSYDKLFATLDSTTRRLKLPEGREVTCTDTVGFIKKLPTTLVEAFKSTLAEISEADLILHVIDASSLEADEQIEAVENVLAQIGAERIPRVDVLNKCDLLDERQLEALIAGHPEAVAISAHTGWGIENLLERIARETSMSDKRIKVLIPYSDGKAIAQAHSLCKIEQETHEADGAHITMLVPQKEGHLFERYEISSV